MSILNLTVSLSNTLIYVYKSHVLGVTCNLISWYVPTVLYWRDRLLNAIKPPKHTEMGIILRIGSLTWVNSFACLQISKSKNVTKKLNIVNVKFGKWCLT